MRVQRPATIEGTVRRLSRKGIGVPAAPLAVGSSGDWGRVTSLPESPTAGDRCRYLAGKTNGVVWSLEYDGEGSCPWKVIGGPPLYIRSPTNVTGVSSTSFTSFASACKLTTPLKGDYDIEWGAGLYCEGGQNAILGLVVDGSTPAYPEGDDVVFAGAGAPAQRAKRALAIGAGKVVEVKYRVSGGSAGQFRSPFLLLNPVRVAS